jgi:hypothetical protein
MKETKEGEHVGGGEEMRCEHGRPDHITCPHCLGINSHLTELNNAQKKLDNDKATVDRQIKEGLDRVVLPTGPTPKEELEKRIERVKMMYRPVIDLDVEPSTYAEANFKEADKALDELIASLTQSR